MGLISSLQMTLLFNCLVVMAAGFHEKISDCVLLVNSMEQLSFCATMLNMSISGDPAERQTLKVVTDACLTLMSVVMRKDDGCIWMPVAELCHFCTKVRRRREREMESEHVRFTHSHVYTHTRIHTVELQLRHTDLSVAKNGKHTCCCWEATRRLNMRQVYMQGFILTSIHTYITSIWR